MNIRKNENVRHTGDLQNLITSAILRQDGMFSKEDIYKKVEKDLEGSDFAEGGVRRRESDVKSRVDDTLNTLSINGCISFDSKQKKYKLTMSFPAVNKR